MVSKNHKKRPELRISSSVEMLFVVDCNKATIFAVYDVTTNNRQINDVY